jgi:hypothetical protein
VKAKPVFGIDVDGTLAEYHWHFLNFAEQWLGREILDQPYRGTEPFYNFIGVSKQTYRRIKLAYRQSGLKRAMPVVHGAPELTKALRGIGAEVWICTTRPYLRVPGVEEDTRVWLRRNGIQYDELLMGEHKYRDLVKHVGAANVVAILDDLPELIQRAKAVNLLPVLLRRHHNTTFSWPLAPNGLAHAQALLLELFEAWRNGEPASETLLHYLHDNDSPGGCHQYNRR